MCESTVFLKENDNISEIMPNVAKIGVLEDKVICIGLLGEIVEIKDVQIIEANLMEHRIVLGKI